MLTTKIEIISAGLILPIEYAQYKNTPNTLSITIVEVADLIFTH